MFEIIFVRNNSISSVYDNIRSFSQLVRRLLKSFTNADDNFEIAGLGDFFFFFDVPSGATTMCVCVFFFLLCLRPKILPEAVLRSLYGYTLFPR